MRKLFATLFILITVLAGMSFDIPGQSFRATEDQVARMPRDTVAADEEDVYFLLVGQADQAITDGDLAQAAMILKDAMAVRPNEPSNILLMSNLGLIYASLGHDSLAMATLDQAHLQAPRMVKVLENRARVNLSAGREAAALADYQRIIELDSINSTARFYHGMMALYGGQPQIARADFEVLQSVVPESLDTHLAMASYYSMTRDDIHAIPHYRKLIELDPQPEYYAALAGCYLDLERLSEASETLADGMKQFPRDAELYYYRAWLNRDRHLNKEARADAQRAIDLGANPARVAQLNIP